MRLPSTLICSAPLWSPFFTGVAAFVHQASFPPFSSVASIQLWTPPTRPTHTVTASAPDSRSPVPRRKQGTLSRAAVQDLEVVALVAGQENYGLAVVCLGEALWSFVQAPSLSQIKVLLPAALAAVVLFAVSGPMIASNDAAAASTGLWIATATSVALGVSYVARLLAPYSPSPKEAAALGLLVAVAGFFSFSQNLVVDGFVALPTLPSLPSLPEVNLNLNLGI